MKCTNCGSANFQSSVVTQTFTIDGRVVVVENVPAEVCARCGEPIFSAETAERLRTLVRQPHPAARQVEAKVVRFEAA